MITIECATCGVVFAVTDSYQARRREDHERFFCPNGHRNIYPQPKVTPEQQEIRDRQQTLDRRAQSYRTTLDTLEDWKKASRICPICEERVTTAHYVETIRSKIAEHLRSEHGAKTRLRAITERATA
jgi:hypothetical protein